MNFTCFLASCIGLKSDRLLVVLILIIGFRHASTAATFYGPTQYFSSSDSAFSTGQFNYFYLENFEDGLLNTPGVSVDNGIVSPPGYATDSVDYGQGGYSYYSNGNLSLTFTFDANALSGILPNMAGIVWTDVGWGGGFYGDVNFTAYDANGALLGTISAYGLGDGTDSGTTNEDRFFGVYNKTGISKITISMGNGDWEVDHLQYGSGVNSSVPEPATMMLLGFGLIALVGVRRKFQQ